MALAVGLYVQRAHYGIMKAIDKIDVDNIWRALGPWGGYQVKQLIWYLLSCCSWAIHMLSIVFIGRLDFIYR